MFVTRTKDWTLSFSFWNQLYTTRFGKGLDYAH